MTRRSMQAHPGDFSDVNGPVIAPSLIDPVALKYLKLLPIANIPGAPPSANYTGNVNNQYFAKTADARVDHYFNERNSMFSRFTYNPTTTVYPTLYPKVGDINPGNGIYRRNSTEDAQAYMLNAVANYLYRNRARMRYQDYLANGWPIASGPVEGACKNLIKDRMERSGMSCTEQMAEALVQLRAVYLSGDFDRYWEFHIEQDQHRLYPAWAIVPK